MASKLDVDEIAAKNGTDPVTLTKQEAAKHWVNYDATNQTTDGSLNQSSITDHSDGTFTSTYTNALASVADKCIFVSVWNTINDGSSELGGSTRGASGGHQDGGTAQSASSVKFQTRFGSTSIYDGANDDMSGSYCMSMGDLA